MRVQEVPESTLELSGSRHLLQVDQETRAAGEHLLRCVDPDDVQVTEVDALLVEESGARAAFGAHVMLLRGGGGRGGRGGGRLRGGQRVNCN